MGKKDEQQYKRNNPLRGAQDSLINICNSFATRQRRLLNQLQQQMSARDSRSDEAPDILDRNSAAPENAPRVNQRSAPRPESYRSSKSSNPPQNTRTRSVLRKEPPNSERRNAKNQQLSRDGASSESDDDLQLNAPPPKGSVTTVDGLSELLFSEDHLQYIVQEPHLYTRFSQFLARYEPHLLPVLLHHMDVQKAAKALEYANAVAISLGPFPDENESQEIETAAVMSKDLQERRQRVLDILMSDALPAQINFGLIDVVTNAMEKAIRGTQQTTLMRGLIGGLSEVFTLTDPSIPDNPIIYASEEFYNMTGYGRDYVIGRNCRFLQGPKTSHHSVRRLKTSIDAGIEISETLLNYRRDGTPFMNLLLVAPLHDSKMKIKYYIGAQVDVTGLVEEGQGLEGFDEFLRIRKREEKLKNSGARDQNLALQKLAELSAMFDVSENSIVRSNSRTNSVTRDSGYGSGNQNSKSTNRRIILEEPQSDEDDDAKSQLTEILDDSKWKFAAPGVATGILPGVYQKYLLLKPASLKVIFVSPGLRGLSKLLKKSFMDCIESTKPTMRGLKEAFESGSPVSAKISWKYSGSNNSTSRENTEKCKAKRDTWISATPMLGSDDSVGVWMIVVVQNSSPSEGTPSQPTTPRLDLQQALQETASTLQKQSTELAPEFSFKRHQKRNSTPLTNFNTDPPLQPRATQPRPKSSSIASVFNMPKSSKAKVFDTSSKRNSVNPHSFSQVISSNPPQANDSIAATFPGDEPRTSMTHTENSYSMAPETLSSLQDSTEVATRRSQGAMKDGMEDVLTKRIRLVDEGAVVNGEGVMDAEALGDGKGMLNSEAEVDGEAQNTTEEVKSQDNGKSVEKEIKRDMKDEDGGVDDVDEDGVNDGTVSEGSDTPTPKAKEKTRGEVFETWSPPAKHLWAKPARPSMPDRTLSID